MPSYTLYIFNTFDKCISTIPIISLLLTHPKNFVLSSYQLYKIIFISIVHKLIPSKREITVYLNY